MRNVKAYTAIELVVVIAVVMIGIVLFDFVRPNIHSAPERSKVARVQADIRTLATGLETYFIDNDCYPGWSADPSLNFFGDKARENPVYASLPSFLRFTENGVRSLTTPVAYLTSLPVDPFAPVKGATFCYWAVNAAGPGSNHSGWIVWSAGPDGKYDLTLDNIAQAYDPAGDVPSAFLRELTYDPSNGTRSAGDVYRVRQSRQARPASKNAR